MPGLVEHQPHERRAAGLQLRKAGADLLRAHVQPLREEIRSAGEWIRPLGEERAEALALLCRQAPRGVDTGYIIPPMSGSPAPPPAPSFSGGSGTIASV